MILKQFSPWGVMNKDILSKKPQFPPELTIFSRIYAVSHQKLETLPLNTPKIWPLPSKYLPFREGKCKVWAKKPDTLKNWPSMRNPQFLSYPHETWWKWSSHEVIIFTKFHEDKAKIVDFLLWLIFESVPFMQLTAVLKTLHTVTT